jgi:hypothetical protein
MAGEGEALANRSKPLTWVAADSVPTIYPCATHSTSSTAIDRPIRVTYQDPVTRADRVGNTRDPLFMAARMPRPDNYARRCRFTSMSPSPAYVAATASIGSRGTSSSRAPNSPAARLHLELNPQHAAAIANRDHGPAAPPRALASSDQRVCLIWARRENSDSGVTLDPLVCPPR